MKIEVDATDITEKKTDGRGRFTLGSEFANKKVTLAVVEVDEDED